MARLLRAALAVRAARSQVNRANQGCQGEALMEAVVVMAGVAPCGARSFLGILRHLVEKVRQRGAFCL